MKTKNDNEIVASLVKKLMKGLHAVTRKVLSEEGLSLSQYYTLYLIKLGSQTEMSEIKNYLDISAASATSIADKLVEKGLIKRQRNSDDRRIVTIDLTDKGKRFLKRMKKRKAQFYSLLFSKIDGKGRKTMKEGLSLFVQSLDLMKNESF